MVAMKRAAVAVLCILLVAATVVTATSHGESGEEPEEPPEADREDDEEDEDDSDETEREREIDVTTADDRVQIESKHEVERGETEQEDKFKLDFSVQMDPRIELSTESETETATSESENESEYKVRFRSVTEFVDGSGNNVYDEGEGVSTYDLSDAAYDDINYTTRTVDGNTVHVIEATTTDDVFTVRLHVVGDITNIDGEQVEPTETKIDLEIHDYNFTSENSSLALQTETESETEHEIEQENGGEETVVRSSDGGGNDMYFSWKNTAQVDGEQTAVRSTEIEADDTEEELFLIYDRGSSIIHDPKIGIETGQSSTGGFFNWLLSFLHSLF